MFQPFVSINRAGGVLFLTISSISLAFSQGTSNEPSPKVKEAPPKISKKAPRQFLPPAVDPRKKGEACTTNRNAPPIGPYHWPVDADVKVYFVRNMFTSEQRLTLLDAMKTWTIVSQEIGSGVRFIEAGETESRMNCQSCLTVGRRDVYKQDKHHYAFFYPMSEDEGRLLVSAWIDLDFGITSPKALAGFMVHELGHGLGLWDCTTCKKKLTIMNGFPGINKNNGLVVPSPCDLETVKDVYQQERQVAAVHNGVTLDTVPTVGIFAAPPRGLDKQNISVLNFDRALAGEAAAKFLGDKRTEIVPANGTLAPAVGLSKAAFAAAGVQRLRIDGAAITKSFADTQPENARSKTPFAHRPLGMDKPNFYLLEFPLPHR